MSPRILLGLSLLCGLAIAQEKPVHHEIVAEVSPATHEITLTDRISPVPGRRFHVHGNLEVTALEGTVRPLAQVEDRLPPLREYEVGECETLVLRLSGKIHHPLQSEEQEYARSFSRTPGIISEKGVVLSGASAWLPRFGEEQVTFKLTVKLPEGWSAVSQGRRTADSTWECEYPTEEVYLIAARFTEYSRAAGNVTAQAFLRRPDPSLAAKYLEVTAQYIEMYRKLIGPYPFSKFALVENFWETGYGMPSFTLLGSQIIRFPFILHSSYPHEILHNWWGNSVYVDWKTGNWCEGLTAYLADHLIREGHGRGVAYRRDTLKKYRAYANDGKDFPLREFRSRHSSATEAVGYGKALMVFHMLRVRLGDAMYVRGLQTFFRRFRYKVASWDDFAGVFSDVAEEDLRPWFRTWVDRPGAPSISYEVEKDTLTLRQSRGGEPWPLRVLVAFSIENEPEARLAQVDLDGYEAKIELPTGTVRVDFDPYYDLFRLLDVTETPPALGDVFGGKAVTLVLPREPEIWQPLVDAWKGEEVEVVGEADLKELPANRAVWVLGRNNRWAASIAPFLDGYRSGPDGDEVLVGEGRYALAAHSFVFAGWKATDRNHVVGWIGCDLPAAVPGLARKLPHYGKYSYLAFQGEEPANVAKGQWAPAHSPMTWGAEHPRATLPRRQPLARLAPVFDPGRLMDHVRYLADEGRQGRGAGSRGLEESADYIAKAFEKAGLKPGGDDGGWFQAWTEPNGPEGKPVRLRNVIGVLPGTEAEWRDQSVVLGAHYDHLGLGWPDVRKGFEGQVHNGADDNASGVAILIEVAALLSGGHEPKRTMEFVAFSGEEWGLKGSRQYVRQARRKARAMVNLDTVGRLGGKKLTIFGSGTASEWIHVARGVGYTTGVEAVCIPQDPGGSDQVAFHEMGIPAVQLFTGAHEDYHRPTDDIEKVDADGMVKVATFVRETLVYLGDRPEPLSSTLAGGGGTKPVRPKTGRRVSLGTMPDFGFGGPGVKVAAVIDGSPAGKAGIAVGDLVLAIDGEEVKSLKSYSDLLKKHAPGDVIRIRLKRGEEELEVEATLVAR